MDEPKLPEVIGEQIGGFIQTAKLFPLSVGFNDVGLKLHADGQVDGDLNALRAAMESAERSFGSYAGFGEAIIWLVARVATLEKRVAQLEENQQSIGVKTA